MALQCAHGAIQWATSDTAGTTKTVSGLAFQPKALIFWTNGLQSATDAASETAVMIQKCAGFATGTSARRCVSAGSGDAAGSAETVAGLRDDAVLQAFDPTDPDPPVGLMDLTSIAADGFELTVDLQNTLYAQTIFWLVLGGSDITVQVVGDIAEPAATGDQDYTVTGFVAAATDQAVFFAGCGATNAANAGQVTDSTFCFGFATGGNDADNVVVMGSSDGASPTMDTDSYCKTGECLGNITLAGGNPNARAKLTQFGTDNFRLNWIARALENRRYIFLAIKGGHWKAGSYTINGNSAAATATVSGLSFEPAGVMVIGKMTAEDSAGVSTAEDRMAIGVGTSPTSRRAMGWHDEHGVGAAEVNHVLEYDQVLAFPSTGGALQAAYDINAINSDGFQMIVDTAGGVASEWQGFMALGNAAEEGGAVFTAPWIE
jgi:hypothetical protein